MGMALFQQKICFWQRWGEKLVALLCPFFAVLSSLLYALQLTPDSVAQARILQRSPQFLKAIFRVYTESVWYPGRQLNHMSMQRGPGAGKSAVRSG